MTPKVPWGGRVGRGHLEVTDPSLHERSPMRRFLLLGVGLLGLVGCTLTTPYAVYKHPVTGDVLACEQNRDVYDAAVYAACKNEIESRGYVRVGTEQREISAKTGVDYTTPRPLPAK